MVFEVKDGGIVKKSVACIETLRVNGHLVARHLERIVFCGWKLGT